MTVEQMELGMNGSPINRLRGSRRQRISRAHWWFARMRQIVELAMPDRDAGLRLPPEQTYLQLGRK